MFGREELAKVLAGLLVGFGTVIASSASAHALELPVETVGFVVPGSTADATLIQRVDLGLAGTAAIDTISLTDTSGGANGAPGVFSGYDLDAFILDRDGDIATAGDQVAFSGLGVAFAGGTIRPTADPAQMPSVAQDVGTHFGTDSLGFIDTATASLGTFDAVNVASTASANGFLSFGDGGELVLTFSDVAVAGGLYLIFGEVGGQGESLRVNVAGQVPLPGTVWLFLSTIAILFGISSRRRFTAV
jgi:hypothetical protein